MEKRTLFKKKKGIKEWSLKRHASITNMTEDLGKICTFLTLSSTWIKRNSDTHIANIIGRLRNIFKNTMTPSHPKGKYYQNSGEMYLWKRCLENFIPILILVLATWSPIWSYFWLLPLTVIVFYRVGQAEAGECIKIRIEENETAQEPEGER